MESPSKKDKDSMIDIKTETPETAGTKAKPGFWSRLKNYTAEPPKTVVIENGIEKLVLIPPKITITPKTVLPKEETIKGKPAEKPISVSQSAVLEEVIEKPAPIQQKAVIKEKPVEKPAPIQQKTIVKEKPAPAPQKAVIKEIPVEK